MKRTMVTSRTIQRISSATEESVQDLLAVEEPLEIRLGYGPENQREQMSLSVTMRTPGEDENLALGFLFSEGIISTAGDVLSVKYCTDKRTGELSENIIRVELSPALDFNPSDYQRNFYATSSCGICGKASIELVEQKCSIKMPLNDLHLPKARIFELATIMDSEQLAFKVTGGIHATVLLSQDLKLEQLSEDIGRHNALDKVIGQQFKKDPDQMLKGKVALLSGRIGFELVQKLAMTGCSIVCAYGAPSSLAIQTAEEFNITLIGFLKKNQYNIYTHPQRIV